MLEREAIERAASPTHLPLQAAGHKSATRGYYRQTQAIRAHLEECIGGRRLAAREGKVGEAGHCLWAEAYAVGHHALQQPVHLQIERNGAVAWRVA